VISRRLTLGTLLLLSSCTSGIAPSSTSAPTVAATQAVVPTRAVTSAPPTSETTSAVTSASTSVSQAKEGHGWLSENIGTSDSYTGGIDHLVFSPDGHGVAFSVIERSCCTNDVRAWSMQPGGSWASIADAQQQFVEGKSGKGVTGGPTQVVWFKDRFVAIGRRDGTTDDQRTSNSTTWTSPDGIAWLSLDETGTSYPVGLTPSTDGASLIGAWMLENGSISLRSTTDGVKWANVGSFSDPSIAKNLAARSITTIPATQGRPAQYVLAGSSDATKPYIAISSDGAIWKATTLDTPTGKPMGSADAALVFDDKLIVYGEAFIDDGAGNQSEAALAWSSPDGVTFTPIDVKATCSGRLQYVTIDQAAPEPTLFGVCSQVEGPVEGDFVDSTTRLVVSHDGVTFDPVQNLPTQWATPSTTIAIGPITFVPGRLVVAVGTTKTEDVRQLTLWKI
jgi:hypothetical protein